MSARHKVHVRDDRSDVAVPFCEVELAASNRPVRLYDTSGTDADPALGLPVFRAGWVAERADIEALPGRPWTATDLASNSGVPPPRAHWCALEAAGADLTSCSSDIAVQPARSA